MKRILFWGAPSMVDISENDTTKNLFIKTGQNTGNLFIGYSVYQQLKFQKSLSGRLEGIFNTMSPEEISDNFDTLVIPASNFINSYQDFSIHADYFEKLKIPCVVIGLGSQVDIDFSDNIKLKKGTLKFLKVLSEKSVSIGVRGNYTADFLSKIGIKNTDVIGCPSFFYRMQPTMAVSKKPTDKIANIAFNSDPSLYYIDGLQTLLAKFYDEMLGWQSRYIVQNEMPLAIMSRNKTDEIPDDVVQDSLAFFKWDKNNSRALNFIKNNIDVFFSIPDWENHIRKFDFSVGPRFHGNMIALQNGVPALILVHDGRTRELCEFLQLPHVFIRDLKSVALKNLYELTDLTGMLSIYEKRYENYISFLNKNGLDHKLKSSK